MPDRTVYLDNNATTPLHPEVKKVMAACMEEFGNPSSLHEFGRRSRQYIEKARETVAGFINAGTDEIIFVGSGSEANNTVLNTLMCSTGKCACGSLCNNGIITTAIEHPCVLETAKCMEERGFPVSFLKVDGKGRIDMDQLKEFLAKGAGLVSVMLANNEIGTVQDIKTIAKISHGAGALVHTDAVQAVGKIPVDVKDLDVDFLTLSAHKIYGPKGVGALYVRKGIPFCPFIRGGHQERGRRAGTENTLGIVALGKAVELRKIEMADEFLRLRDLRTFFSQGIEKNIPNVKMNGDEKNCLPNTLNVSFAGAEGEAILLYLDLEGIAVSTGSACASGSLDPSHVLLALGLPAEEAHGAIRFSMGRETTEEDINYVLTKLPKVIEKIRNMSSAYMRK